MTCVWCKEPIEEPAHPSVAGTEMHQECAYRAACGSVAHLSHNCSCYIPGSLAGDPPDMSKREAALAAWTIGKSLQDIRNRRDASLSKA